LPYRPKLEAQPIQQTCYSSSEELDDNESTTNEVVVNSICNCENPYQCECTDPESFSSTTNSSLPTIEKLKVCMHNYTGDSEAQMLAQIKSLPDGDMKTALLEAYVKAVKTEQKGKSSKIVKRQPLFLDASFEKNTKTYIKFNREPRLQDISVSDLAKEASKLKTKIGALRQNLDKLQLEVENGYPIDFWARQEINLLKEKLDSIPPPLEEAPFESPPRQELTGITRMQVLPISCQKYYIKVQIEICNEVFSLTALIDTGSDINLLHKEKIPAKYWTQNFGCVTGLGNHSVDFKYEVPRANILLKNFSLGMRFHITDSPIDCILGAPFLAMVSPHGSCNIGALPGYFITIPATQHSSCTRVEIPFISEQSKHIGHLTCLVIVETFDQERQQPRSTHYDDDTPWEIFKENWRPTWQLRHSEIIHLGLPGFSRNTSPTVLPPQHVLGHMHQPITITSREKLVEFGDLTRLRIQETQWYEPAIRAWCRSPVCHSFQINRMRALTDWPHQDPNENLFGINYDQYKAAWFHAFLWRA